MPIGLSDWPQRHPAASTVTVVVVTAGVRFVLTPWLGNDAPFLLFTLPVMGLGIVVGTSSAVVASILSLGAGLAFASIGSTLRNNLAHAGLFVIVATIIIWLTGRFREAMIRQDAADRHLRSILDTVPEAIIVTSDDSRITSFSPAAERMFGVEAATLIGQPFARLLQIDDPGDSHIAKIGQANAEARLPAARPSLAVRANGTSFPVALAVGKSESSGQTIYTGFMRDLTTEQAAAAHIAGLQARLDQVGRLGAMGAMASTLAHELNQPIMAVAAFLRTIRLLLARAGRPDDIDGLLDSAESEALRAGEIIRQLRSYVARGEVEQTVEPLPSLIREAVALGLAGLRDREVEVHYDFDPATPQVHVNRVQLQQVLINLVRNAVEASDATAPVWLTLSTKRDDDGFARITVADRGHGILPDVASRLFDAFATTKAGGLGLGLPISRTIIEANGGKIWASTRLPASPTVQGATEFHIALHAAEPSCDDSAGAVRASIA